MTVDPMATRRPAIDRPSSAAAFFSLSTQFENVGDALINRELIALAAEHMPVFVDLSRCPPSFVRTLRLEVLGNVSVVASSASLFFRLAQHRLRGGRPFYFLSPGGYSGEKAIRPFLSALLNSAVLVALRSVGTKICHFGVSYENLGARHLFLLRARAPLLHAHYLRDLDSARYCGELGLPVSGILPDLALNAARLAEPTRGAGVVALSFRTDQAPDQRARVQDLVGHLMDYLPPSTAWRLVIQVERDRNIMLELQQNLLAAGRTAELVAVSDDIESAFRAYANCEVVVSNRLHALLIASLVGVTPVPVVMAGKNRKIEGLFRSLGLGEQVGEMDDHDAVARRVMQADVLFDAMPHRYELQRAFREMTEVDRVSS